MSAVSGADRSSRVTGVTPVETTPPSPEASRLREPEARRNGGLPAQRSNRWSPFRGQLLAGAAMIAIAATSLPLMTGCSLADTPAEPTAVEQVQDSASTAESTTVRGAFVEAPVPGGEEAGIWLAPIGRGAFTVDGQTFDRIYIGVAGSDATRGLVAGGLGDLTGRIVTKGDVAVVDGVDAIVRGLPRDFQGTVREGPAPGAEGGAEPDHLYLLLDTPIWLNGAQVESLHLGAKDAPEFAHLGLGDHVSGGGRIDARADGAYLASTVTMTAERYGGSAEIVPPTFDGVTFHAAGDPSAQLPVIDLGRDGDRREVVVVDAELGVAHLGSVAAAAGSEQIDATRDIRVFVQGGPTFDVDRGRVVDGDGYKLAPKHTWVEHGENGDTHHGWYLHESSDTLYQLSFTLDADGHADPARATHAIDLGDR